MLCWVRPKEAWRPHQPLSLSQRQVEHGTLMLIPNQLETRPKSWSFLVPYLGHSAFSRQKYSDES